MIDDTVKARIELLRGWLARRVAADALDWVDEQTARVTDAPAGLALSRALGLVPRRVGRGLLQLDAGEIAHTQTVRPGLDPSDWTLDQVARILFALASTVAGEEQFVARLDALLRSGEIGEQIALFRGLPLYPASQRLLPLAGEGIRSAMQPVYEAVAHRSPYPTENFSEPMWNQMVVKALFIGSTLAPIQGLDDRRNADLARMLVDYAHERWAASRDVKPELWRCVGPFATSEDDFADLLRVFASDNNAERYAAALALSECPTPDALVLLESAPDVWRDIRNGKLNWEMLA